MFTFFIIFIENLTATGTHPGIRIPDSNENMKEFISLMDVDGGLSVELEEMNAFFENYVNIEKRIFKLEMTKGLDIGTPVTTDSTQEESKTETSITETTAPIRYTGGGSSATKKIRVKVLNDFEPKQAEKMRLIEGIPKKDDERDFEIPEGPIIYFGRDTASDFCIPLPDIDNKQFSIYNRDGNLYLVDMSNNYPTRIKVFGE